MLNFRVNVTSLSYKATSIEQKFRGHTAGVYPNISIDVCDWQTRDLLLLSSDWDEFEVCSRWSSKMGKLAAIPFNVKVLSV